MSNTSSTADPTNKTEDAPLNWEKHLQWLAPVTALILIATTAIMWIKGKETNVRVEVMQAYTLATTAEELQILADAYPDEPEAPLARLQAASMLYNDGEFEKALADYRLFLERHATHPMADNAQWGTWMCQEGLGNLEEALEGFRTVTEEQILYPQSLLGQARILEKQNQPEAALEIYATLQEDFPESSFSEQARIFSQQIMLASE